MKFFIKTFGCQYNEWDAARLSFLLTSNGLLESTGDDAEIVFILNCSVRKTGVDRAMSNAQNYLKSNQKVVITGCILERDKKIFTEKGAILWDGENFDRLGEILGDYRIIQNIKDLPQPPSTNLVPIMKGCNNFCSYCAVPYVRGREVSESYEKIIQNVQAVLAAGHKEVWLIGQNVNSYQDSEGIIISSGVERSCNSQKVSPTTSLGRNDRMVGFAQLLEKINNIPGDFKIYSTSNHPKDMNDEIVEAIATLPKVAKYIHLPLQSGSDKILQSMNRPYTKEKYLALVEKIRKKIPDVTLSTDTIIGFPGETEEDFLETVELLKQVKFNQVFNNKYSPRSGTKAFKLGDPIPWQEKERRWQILNELCNKKSRK